jgi:cytochrome d ubiquinol oxidase subunit I
MIVAGLTGALLWWRGRLFETRWYLWPAQHAWWIGFVAVICGWIVTETGRQPWVAYGILRTAEAASPLAAHTVATTLVMFVVVYAIVLAMAIYYINRLIAHGPQGPAVEPPAGGMVAPPLSPTSDAKIFAEAN